jgi:ligand-binding sensor domain-containing protein
MLLAATDQGIYRKNADDSTVWQEPNPSGRGRALSLMVNAGKIYAGMTGNGVKRSDDGVEWRDSFESTSNLRSKSVSALLYHSKNGFYYAGTLSGDIYFSPSGDGNWQLLDRQNLPLEASIRALEQSGSNLYAGTDFGVFEFDNAKQSWSQINAGLFTGVCLESVFDVYVTSFALRPTIDNSSVICAGTRGGVFCYEQLRK